MFLYTLVFMAYRSSRWIPRSRRLKLSVLLWFSLYFCLNHLRKTSFISSGVVIFDCVFFIFNFLLQPNCECPVHGRRAASPVVRLGEVTGTQATRSQVICVETWSLWCYFPFFFFFFCSPKSSRYCRQPLLNNMSASVALSFIASGN